MQNQAKSMFMILRNLFRKLAQGISHRQPIFWIVIFVSLLLSSCVKYDLEVNFHNSNNGELVQHIQLAKKLTSFSGDYIQEWWKNLANQARNLGGSVEQTADSETTEIILKVPFSNVRELSNKFNSLFGNSSVKHESKRYLPDTGSKLWVEELNLGVVSRNHLIYHVDLRSLSPIVHQGNDINTIINLDFGLQTPWGISNSVQNSTSLNPLVLEKQDNQNIWRLQPGQLNQIEVTFWLPNFLGIGTLLIIFFVWWGYYLKYSLIPKKDPDSTKLE